VWLATSLLPISQSTKWDAIPRRKFFLRQSKCATNNFHLWDTLHLSKIFFCQRWIVGIAESCGLNFFIYHWSHWRSLAAVAQYLNKCTIRSSSSDSSILAHALLPFVLKLTKSYHYVRCKLYGE